MPPQGTTFRPIRESDKDFLRRLYASTREEELAATPWTEAYKAEFLRGQFEAQHSHYMSYFTDASFDLILQGDTPIGRLYIEEREKEFRIIDIALLPEYRRRGLGRALLEEVLERGRAAAKAVRIHVETNNPAMRLYLRLGFSRIEDQGPYYLMEWTADSPLAVASQNVE